MDLAPGPGEGDLVIEQDGAILYVASAAVPYLDGTTIDYVTGLHNAGFRFVNPQATRTCGCGESFSV
jgi:iron-sulfur cluster assembly protein